MAIDGVTVPAFSAGTLPPPPEKSMLREQAVAASRQKYAMSRSDVEEYIAEWSSPMDLSSEWKQKEGISTEKRSEGKTRTESPSGIVTFSQPKAEPKIEPVPTEQSGKGESQEKDSGLGEALEKNKIQIINDRFSRKWYAISPKEKGRTGNEVEQAEKKEIKPEAKKIEIEPAVASRLVWEQPDISRADVTPATPKKDENVAAGMASQSQGREVGEKDEPLITWEKATELGSEVVKTEPRPHVESNDFLPIDEL